jgi:proteic killer suppression protein
MIVSYRDKRTERFARGERIKEFSGIARQAETRLDRLDAAARLCDLAALPGNPESSPGPMNVEIVDYH